MYHLLKIEVLFGLVGLTKRNLVLKRALKRSGRLADRNAEQRGRICRSKQKKTMRIFGCLGGAEMDGGSQRPLL